MDESDRSDRERSLSHRLAEASQRRPWKWADGCLMVGCIPVAAILFIGTSLIAIAQ
jgi:hypothetical protein